MDKLAKYIIVTAVIAILGFLAWYFSSVLVYIVVAAVVALIGRPLMKLLCKIHIRSFKMPRWLASILTILTILTAFFSLFFLLTPIVGQIVHQLSNVDFEQLAARLHGPLSEFNEFITKTIPSLDDSFKIERYTFNYVKDLFSMSMISDLVNSLTSFIVDFSVAIFSIVFMSFFFLMDEGLITNVMVAALPDKYEENVRRASDSIANLLTRYFLGITLESCCIALLNGLGLIFIVGMDPSIAIVIASVSGVLNVIPYVGPLVGDVIAVLMGFVTYVSSGVSIHLGLFLLLILVVFVVTQLIDNYIFQPLIYSSSVKAHPLEIFVVILLAGHIGGVVGMLVAIPSYTVLRVIGSEFFSHLKVVKKLTEGMNEKE